MVIVIDSVYSVTLPAFYHRWLSAFTFIKLDWSRVLLPNGCLANSYREQMLIKALVPLALVGGVIFLHLLWSVVAHYGYGRSGPPRPIEGLLSSLPHVLIVLFLTITSISSAIFHAWACVGYKDSDTSTRYFLSLDPTIECYAAEHTEIVNTAYGLMLLLPIGVPVLFTTLLFLCRKPLLRRRPTRSPPAPRRAASECRSRARTGCRPPPCPPRVLRADLEPSAPAVHTVAALSCCPDGVGSCRRSGGLLGLMRGWAHPAPCQARFASAQPVAAHQGRTGGAACTREQNGRLDVVGKGRGAHLQEIGGERASAFPLRPLI